MAGGPALNISREMSLIIREARSAIKNEWDWSGAAIEAVGPLVIDSVVGDLLAWLLVFGVIFQVGPVHLVVGVMGSGWVFATFPILARTPHLLLLLLEDFHVHRLLGSGLLLQLLQVQIIYLQFLHVPWLHFLLGPSLWIVIWFFGGLVFPANRSGCFLVHFPPLLHFQLLYALNHNWYTHH